MAGANYVPIWLAAATIVISALAARHFVKNPQTRKEFEPALSDLIPLALGFLGMAIGAILQDEASVWSYFIDLGSFAVGTSLFATAKPNSWARIVGLLVVGIHVAQVVATNVDAPLYPAMQRAAAFLGF